jgi:hypothetical protein
MSNLIGNLAMNSRTNVPKYTLILAGILSLSVVAVVLFAPERNSGNATQYILWAIVTLPGLIGAAFSERNSRDIRNGVVVDKVKEGTKQALVESGVQDVVDASARGQASTLVMQALSELLKANTAVHITREEPPKTTEPPRSPNSGD